MSDPTQPPVLPPERAWPAWVAALAIGAGGWIITMVVGDRSEAWDSPVYYQFAYPVFALSAAVLGYLRPGRPWRWALGIGLGQALVAFARNPTANLLPLGLIAFAVYSAPLILVARLGQFLRRWRDGRE